jgi:Family of unknown function (DUF6065)
MQLPIATFYRLIECTRHPMRADKSALGTMPARALRYCEPLRAASGFGWYVFPPTDFDIKWDGNDLWWQIDGANDWETLETIQFPDQTERFNRSAPDDIQGFSTPWLTKLPEPGVFQLWSGLIARTQPGISLLVRQPANLPQRGGYELYEGIVETDRWFGPLFTNIRITRTNAPVHFKSDFPLVQVQPIPQDLYSEQTLSSAATVASLGDFGSLEWDMYRATVVAPNECPNRSFGTYAARSRIRAVADAPKGVSTTGIFST